MLKRLLMKSTDILRGNQTEYFRNRKGHFSWSVQVICDSTLIIQDIIAK